MLKRSIQSLFGLLGFRLVRKGKHAEPAPVAPSVPTPPPRVETPVATSNTVTPELDALRAEVAQLKADLATSQAHANGYKGAYSAVCTELSNTQVILKKLQPDGIAIVKESLVADPPIQKRLKDNPELIPVLKADCERLQIPHHVVRMLLDPDFSIEDRAKYREPFQDRRQEHWEAIASVIAKIVNTQYVQYQPRGGDPEKVKLWSDTLSREGLVRLPRLLSDQQVRETQKYFLERPIFNGHIPTSARHRNMRRYVNYTAENFGIGSYPIGDVALAPHMLELVLSPLILDTAARFFGCAPQLTWLQSWWNFKGDSLSSYGQNYYHRDETDFRMFWFYMYLTDVEDDCGPHHMIRQSGDFDVVRANFAKAKANPELAAKMGDLKLEDLYCPGHSIPDDVKEALFPGNKEILKGPAGTMFLSRGIDYHRVTMPIMRKRQIFAARFVINEFACQSPDRDGDPIPGEIIADRIGCSDDVIRHITKMRFDWSHPKWTAKR